MCKFYLSDISPEKKGNRGESIYGPTFEGKMKNITRHLHYYNENILCMCVYHINGTTIFMYQFQKKWQKRNINKIQGSG